MKSMKKEITKKLFLDRKVRGINFTDPSANLQVAQEISKDLEARFGAPIPVSIAIVDERTVDITFTVSFRNTDTSDLNGAIPDSHLILLTGEWDDWKPEYSIPMVPFRGYKYYQWNTAKEDFEADFKRNNKFYGGNRVKAVSAEIDETRMKLTVVFG